MSDFDVIIIGYGPTGKIIARQLSDWGHRVAIVDRWPDTYPLPRAIGYDHEIKRMFHALGLADKVAEISRSMERYVWYNADWKVLFDIDESRESNSGGPSGYTFSQPDLEKILQEDLSGRPGLTFFLGEEARSASAGEDYVEVAIAPSQIADTPAKMCRERRIRARYLVGCDGAKSLIRNSMQSQMFDHGFDETWVVIDVHPYDLSKLRIPDAAQWCNPRRPTTIVPSGVKYRRWEFMLLEGENPEELSREERIWQLLAPWMTPSDGKLIRRATYRFRSLLAQGWRKGRFLLAGDAAHLMPPFMGQGMCAGMRDVWNLGWKLDRVLKGRSSERLLDSYEAERAPHVDSIIRISIAMGKVICMPDENAAQERDEAFFSGRVPSPPSFPGLVAGAIARDAEGRPVGCAGQLLPHDILERDGAVARLDDIIGRNFALLTRSSVSATLTSPLDIKQIVLGDNGFRDINGRLSNFLDSVGAHAVLARPDFYAFGSVPQADDVEGLIRSLEIALN